MVLADLKSAHGLKNRKKKLNFVASIKLESLMKHIIGIRHEDKYVMERRVALIPNHISQLVKENIGFEVEDIFALTKEEFLFTSLEEKRKALILEEIEGKPENLKEKMEEMEVFFNPPSIF